MKKNVSRFVAAKKAGTKLWKKRVRKFFNNKLAVFGFAVILLFFLCSAFAPLITHYDPLEPNFKTPLANPSKEHWFGTDSLGRDLFTRIVYGGRISMFIAVAGSLLGNGIGLVIGAVGGFFGGIIDKLFVRISEIMCCIPQLILVLVVMTFIRPGMLNLIFIFALTGWTGTFRLVRAEYITKKEETYVKVCEAFGMSKVKIMFNQILPSVLTLVIVQITMNVPGYVMSEASLSFLGFGVPMSVPTWGTMLNAARSSKVILYNPAVWIAPGTAICLFVLAVNFFGDGLRDVIDPKQQ